MMTKALVVFVLFLCLVSCQPALVERPTTEIIRGTSRPNAIDKDSFYADRREGRYKEWTGGARSATFREALRIRYNIAGDSIEGDYALGSVGVLNFGYLGTGQVKGTITNGVIDWLLTMENGCQYSVFGSVTDDHILVFAEPINCDADSQKWDLGRS